MAKPHSAERPRGLCPAEGGSVNHRNAMAPSAHILNPAVEAVIQAAEMAIQGVLILNHARQGRILRKPGCRMPDRFGPSEASPLTSSSRLLASAPR
jgi:hypothetical protein